MEKIIIQLIAAFLGSLGFAMLFHLRRGLLFPASLGGFFSWGLYLLGMQVWESVFAACLAAAAFSAFYGEILARLMRAPATLFFIPAAVPLIPGNPLYQTMSGVAQRDWLMAQHYGLLTIQYALAIALGIILVWSCFVMGTRIRFYMRNKHLFAFGRRYMQGIREPGHRKKDKKIGK